MNEPANMPPAAKGNSAAPARVRWWPLVVILVLAAAGWLAIWFTGGNFRQERNIRLALLVIGTGLGLFAWSLFFCGLPWRTRLLATGAGLGSLAVLAGLFRIRGVTGDLIPILEWRWRPANRPTGAAPLAQVPSSQTTAPASAPVAAAAYPQFLGPNRNATVAGPELARDWARRPPTELWRRGVGAGWSGFAVVAGRAITQEQHGDAELVTCYDLRTGTPVWSHSDQAHYQTTLAGEGPRATPTIAGDRVYALGATGILNCLDLASGHLVWTKNVVQENQGQVPEWGVSCSPLVWRNLVIVSAGGGSGPTLTAFDAGTGKLAWAGGSRHTGYSSPYQTVLAGVPQVLIFNGWGLAGQDLTSGRVLWEYGWPRGHPHVAMPVALPHDQVLVSSGYGTGSAVVSVARDASGQWSAKPVWKSTRLKAKFTNVVQRDGYIYGLDDGTLVCLEAATGQLKWKDGRYGHGQVILVGRLLLVSAEEGDVCLLEPVPEGRRELGRFTAFRRKTWNPPALAGALLLVRNDVEAACYRLPLAD